VLGRQFDSGPGLHHPRQLIDAVRLFSLTAYERALKLYPVRDVRPKITHCTLVNDDLIRRA
jgi:hypothetical protein